MYNNAILNESNRIFATPVQGEQSCMVQSDMKDWALSEDIWSTAEYVDIVNSHAKARGWTQDGFTGMEIFQ